MDNINSFNQCDEYQHSTFSEQYQEDFNLEEYIETFQNKQSKTEKKKSTYLSFCLKDLNLNNPLSRRINKFRNHINKKKTKVKNQQIQYQSICDYDNKIETGSLICSSKTNL